jgi:hypothetical protein
MRLFLTRSGSVAARGVLLRASNPGVRHAGTGTQASSLMTVTQLAHAWNLTEAEVARAQAHVNACHEIPSTARQSAMFLLAKNGNSFDPFRGFLFTACSKDSALKERFWEKNSLRGIQSGLDALSWCFSASHPYAVNMRKRLDNILYKESLHEGNDKRADVIPSSQSFDTFVKNNPKWAAGESFVYFRDHVNLASYYPHTVMQAQQKTGVCFFLAACITHYYWYLCAPGHAASLAARAKPPAVDLKSFIVRYMDGADLTDIILYDNGCNPVNIMKKLVAPDKLTVLKDDIPKVSFEENGIIRKCLQGVGPLLVTNFGVDGSASDFMNTKKLRHVGPAGANVQKGAWQFTHAMVLVGWRRDQQSGRYLVLLQNWWWDKQFVEMDYEYLISTGAWLVYLDEPLSELALWNIKRFEMSSRVWVDNL